LLSWFSANSEAQQVIDRIVAVVGEQIILQSELDFQLQLLVAQTGQKPTSEVQLRDLKRRLLDQMINDRLILAQAEKDTSLSITSKEIETALEEHLQRIRSQFASEEEFLQQLSQENLSVRELKIKYRADMRAQILKEKLIGQKLGRVTVSAKEVRDFYQQYQDSLPVQQAGLKLSHILLEVLPTQKTLDSLRSLMEDIRQKASAGADFSTLAKAYSQDPTAQTGGDLGFFGRGELDSAFEKVAFSLSPGEISGVVRTQVGFHLIKVEERKAGQVRTRHILIFASPSADDEREVQKLADSLYLLLKNGADFGALAQKFSNDVGSQKLGGDLGWVNVEVLEPVFKQALANLQIEEITAPFKSPYGIHIFKLQDKRDSRRLTLEQDWDSIKEMAKRHKTGQEIQKWVADLRQKIYLEVKEST
jgi:peptidyl-prolyl cis-trans isomerase SurA